MQLGVCGDPSLAARAAQAGFDYFEWSVGGLLNPREPEAAFQAALDAVQAAPLPCPVVNCFVPGDLKITGPDVDRAALREYVTVAATRAEQAGVDTIVFGSGGARCIPDGFDAKTARDQIVSFCSMVAPIANDHGVTVVIEPLNLAECNILTSVAECAGIVRAVAHPGMRLLVDAYHLMRDNDPYADIVANGDLLSHVHIATTSHRLPPGVEPCDFAPFFTALASAGYNGRVSVEAAVKTPETDLPPPTPSSATPRPEGARAVG